MTAQRATSRANTTVEATTARRPGIYAVHGAEAPAYRPACTYYDYPMLKPPHWKWEIYVYFFLSGIASAAYVTAAIADLFGRRKHTPVVRTGRYLALPLLGLCTLLLVKDLGRPERFHHMMRIYKTRSPMSVGTWALSALSVFSGLAALRQMASDGVLGKKSLSGRVAGLVPSRTVDLLGGFAGFFVAGYTGSLLSATASPLWGRARALMAPIFIASASSTALAAISLILSLAGRVDEDTKKRLKRADSLALLIELGLLALLPRTLGPLTRFLLQGRHGALYLAGVTGGIAVPLLMQVKSGLSDQKASRLGSAIASSLVLVGGLVLRYLFLAAGKASMEDQEAVIDYSIRPT